ncbi:Mov34/MPN/PAD-1 family protein [Spirochaetia bacterium]|nr:Mov34/MPN/PAD-1 family protein [Spirochaetia bacterium]
MLIFPQLQADKMISHALSCLPNEACGLLAGVADGENKTVKNVYCLKNSDESPEHFAMLPEEQFAAIADMRRQGTTLLGNFHSHPATPARPSKEDIRLAFDPSLSYVILSLAEKKLKFKSFIIKKADGSVIEEIIRLD